jgi:hypothetical protein
MTSQQSIRDAQLQDVRASSLMPHIPNPLALDTPNFLVEYGVRADDQAFVFHFFSAMDKSEWDPAYKMDVRLRRGIDKNFDTTKVTCGFAVEVDSFYVIVGGLGAGPDPWPLVNRFLSDVQAPLEAAS